MDCPYCWTFQSGKLANFSEPAVLARYGDGVDGPATPGIREMAATWLDEENGYLYLFGGFASAPPRLLADLWRLDTQTIKWTFITGSNQSWHDVDFDTTLSTAWPAPRYGSATWTDRLLGRLYLFGGSGRLDQYLGDVWYFSLRDLRFVWVSGSNQTYSNGSYPAERKTFFDDRVATPPARKLPIACYDDSTRLAFMFGGFSYSMGRYVHLNDLWVFDLDTQLWAWWSGSNSTDPKGQYSISSNEPLLPGPRRSIGRCFLSRPQSRSSSANISDIELYFYGGYGFGNTTEGFPGFLADLWSFSFAEDRWHWKAGPEIALQLNTEPKIYNASYPLIVNNGAGWASPRKDGFFVIGRHVFADVPTDFTPSIWFYGFETAEWSLVKTTNFSNSGNYTAAGLSDSQNSPGTIGFTHVWTVFNNTIFFYGGSVASGTLYSDSLWTMSLPLELSSTALVGTVSPNYTIIAGNVVVEASSNATITAPVRITGNLTGLSCA